MIQQKGEGKVNRLRLNHMVIIQDKDKMTRKFCDFVEQRGQYRFGRRWLGRLQPRQKPFTNARCNRLQCPNDIRQKAVNIIIPLIQGNPGGRLLAAGDPFADQGAFPKTCRGRDK